MKLSQFLPIITFLSLTATALSVSSREATPFSRRAPQDNSIQMQTTEEEFAQKMNDAAWKTASSVASDKIQRRSAEPQDDATEATLLAAELAAQNQMQAQTAAGEAAQQMNDAAWKIASDVASDKIQ